MTDEEKQLLLKDICARLPYGIFVKEGDVNDRVIYTYDYHPHIETCKPYLRPMSSMTEEELHEYNMHLFGITIGVDAMNFMIWIYQHYLDILHFIEKGLALEAPEDMYKIK